MADFAVRRATEGDLDQLVDVYIAVAAEGRWIGGELPIDRDEALQRRKESLASETELTWVAEADDVLIGQLGLSLRRGRADLGMAIVEGWRTRGVGSAMMEVAIAWARDADLDKIFLMVWPHNERAIGLYEKFGFQREGYHRMHHRRKSGEAWDVIPMGLLLKER